MSIKKENLPAEAEKENLPVSAGMSFEEDAGAGTEGADKSSYAIPFISLLQAGSPQVNSEKPLEGARAGVFFNNITNEMATAIKFVPAAFTRRFIRWGVNRSGFKGEFNPIDVETGRVDGMSVHNGRYLMEVPTGAAAFDSEGKALYDELADTRNHFVLYQATNGSWQPAIISLSSTQIKKSKRLMSLISGIELSGANGKPFNPPSYSHVYVATPVFEKNAKGQNWWGLEFKVERQLQAGEENLYAKAKGLNRSVVEGMVTAEPPAPDTGEYVDNIDKETGEVKF